MSENLNESSAVPLPPADATAHTTACEYCPVACGYKVYTWPVGQQAGQAADENALGVDYPTVALSGSWISETMHNTVRVDGQPHHLVVLPDPETEVVNKGGTHSARGGQLAQRSTPMTDKHQIV